MTLGNTNDEIMVNASKMEKALTITNNKSSLYGKTFGSDPLPIAKARGFY